MAEERTRNRQFLRWFVHSAIIISYCRDAELCLPQKMGFGGTLYLLSV